MEEDLLTEFIVETSESLDQLDQHLLELEAKPDDKALLNDIFRGIHTIKGTCGFLELEKLESITHTGETLLDNLRSGKTALSEEIVSALLDMLDAIRTTMENLETNGNEGQEDFSALVLKLSSFTIENSINTSTTSEVQEQQSASNSDEDLDALFAEAQATYVNNKTEKTAEPIEVAEDNKGNVKTSKISETSLRVDVGLIDRLMNLVGELVLNRNQILQFSTNSQDNSFSNVAQQLDLITTELQENIMKTRMQPISNIWNKFPRVVRDVAKNCNKEVIVEMEGEDTELDKTVIEAIKDPLTHIVRNSIDHGIELPAVRSNKGKTPQGLLKLRACHEGGNVLIEISDDGAGINTQRVKGKILEKGLADPKAIESMSENEIQEFIFHPGFSTAEKVSNISGRGVGMDVVKTNLMKIGGSIELNSKQDLGTCLKIKIPLTLAIVPALIVTQSKQRFAIPQSDLVELFRVEDEEIDTRLEDIHGATFIRLREKLLPIVKLKDILQLNHAHCSQPEAVSTSLTKQQTKHLTIVVVRVGDREYGLVVDEVHDTQEIVVKPLGQNFKGIEVFAGASIMGDGEIALILDASGVANKAQVLSKNDTVPETNSLTESIAAEARRSLVIAKVSDNQRIAIELEKVSRLEEFSRADIELGSGCKLIRYCDGLLRLVDLPKKLVGEEHSEQEQNEIKVIVIENNSQKCGLIVREIVDIVDQEINLESWDDIEGIQGSAVIQGKVTDLIDLSQVINSGKV